MIVDIHGHITSPALLRRYPMPPSLGDVEGMLEQKAELGIDVTICGTPVGAGTMTRMPGHDNYSQTSDQLKAHHDWLAETVAAHPGRLKAYAYVNPFGGSAMLEDAATTVRDGGFVGMIVNSSVKGQYLDSPGADDFFAMASELDVPVFIHPPAEPVGSDSLRDFRLVEQIGRFCDITLCLATLVLSGRLEQYPNLQVIGATAGGAISLVADRLDTAFAPTHWGPPGGGPPGGGPSGGGPPGGGPPGGRYEYRIKERPSQYLRQLHVDTANSSVPNHLANLDILGVDRMMYGTDSPPLAKPLKDTLAMIDSLPITEDDRAKILSGNAKRVFKLDDVN